MWQPEDIERAFQVAAKWSADALFIASFGGLLNAHRERVVDLAAKTRMPAMYTNVEWVVLRGLIAYSSDIIDHYRRAASYVVRILKGAKPADLPIEQPTKFELAINMKTAKALGLTIPPAVMLQATRVIE